MGPTLSSLFDLDELVAMIDDGFVREIPHPSSPLRMLSYTAAAQYGRVWNDVTRTCRGLIVSDDPRSSDCRVVARPFVKFANWFEHTPDSPFGPLPPPETPVGVTEKFDGSLVIAFHTPDGQLGFATRGSFVSAQAAAALRLWHDRFADVVLDEHSTWLFEYVGPDNQVVVRYEQPDLVLLGRVDLASGRELSCRDVWPGKVASVERTVPLGALIDEVTADDVPAVEREGLVALVPSPGGVMRVKFKFASYVRTHRVVTNLSPTSIVKALQSQGKEALLSEVPDEFHHLVRPVIDAVEADVDAVLAAVDALWAAHGWVSAGAFADRELDAATSDLALKARARDLLAEPTVGSVGVGDGYREVLAACVARQVSDALRAYRGSFARHVASVTSDKVSRGLLFALFDDVPLAQRRARVLAGLRPDAFEQRSPLAA